MSGPNLYIRPGMDVYSTRQDRYLGSVVRVIHGEPSVAPDDKAQRTGSAGPPGDAPMVHEEGNVTGSSEPEGKLALGESRGPVPSGQLGNTGPDRQSAGQGYATRVRDIPPDVAYFLVRPGRVNWWFLTPTFSVPTSAVRSISMERVVVDWE
jgi:hypothetical protein